jgi:replicative DNA helicase
VSAAERELIGSVLTDTRLYPLARDEVTGDDFEDPRLGLIWDGVGRVLDSGGDVNKVSIIDHLREWDVRG